jgi:hypothetical protein
LKSWKEFELKRNEKKKGKETKSLISESRTEGSSAIEDDNSDIEVEEGEDRIFTVNIPESQEGLEEERGSMERKEKIQREIEDERKEEHLKKETPPEKTKEKDQGSAEHTRESFGDHMTTSTSDLNEKFPLKKEREKKRRRNISDEKSIEENLSDNIIISEIFVNSKGGRKRRLNAMYFSETYVTDEEPIP